MIQAFFSLVQVCVVWISDRVKKKYLHIVGNRLEGGRAPLSPFLSGLAARPKKERSQTTGHTQKKEIKRKSVNNTI